MKMNEIIKTYRTKLGLSQEDLGKKVGVNKAAVQKWENGTVENMKRSTIKILADLFGICPAELLGWGDEYSECINNQSNIHNSTVVGTNNGKFTVNNNRVLSAQEQDLLRIFNEADGKQQMQIMQYIYDLEDKIHSK